MISSTDLPRLAATSSGVFNWLKPSMVASTTFCLLLDPRDFVRIFLIPASSHTLRTGPPAITPVPSGAFLRRTVAEPNLPRKSWVILLFSSSATLTRFLAASSFPLRIASGISVAFPRPTPTCPAPSPTTTKAVKRSYDHPLQP